MIGLDVDFEAFFEWLAAHGDSDVVGWPGRCFNSPLARWLSALVGCVIGVEDGRYGWALADVWRWYVLPKWAQMFEVFCESRFGGVLTAYEAVEVLAQVEVLLSSFRQVAM